MIEEIIDERELAFANELGKYEGKWVAILNYGSDDEIIVGNGETIIDARADAESKGFQDVTFFKVPPSNRIFVP
jgi:hypothetical protein